MRFTSLAAVGLFVAIQPAWGQFIRIPMIRVPIRPGRNITSIIEVAARNLLLKFQGKHSALEFQERLNRALIEARPEKPPMQMDDVE